MIFQSRGDGLLAVRQTDHGRLAGDIAAAWGGDAWRPDPWPPLVLAARLHDDGWAPWESEPTLHPDGRPVDFLTLPTQERIPLYRRSVEGVHAVDRHAGLLTSLHVTGLFLGRYEPGAARAVDLLDGEDRAAVDRFVAEQEAWRVFEAAEVDPPDLWAQYRLLQVFDMLSLTLCMRPGTDLEGLGFEHVPLGPGRTAALKVHRDGDTVVVSPWPFAEPEIALGVAARPLRSARFASLAAYRDELGRAPVEHLSFRLARP